MCASAWRPAMKAFKILGLLGTIILTVSCTLDDPKAPFSEGNASFDYKSFDASAEPAKANDDGLITSVTYRFEACLFDIRYRDIVQYHTFEVTRPGGEKSLVTSNQQGCIDWKHDVSFHFFGKPSYIEQRYVITPHNSIHQGQLILKAALNPRAVAYGLKQPLVFADLNKKRDLDVIPQEQVAGYLSDTSYSNFKVEMPSASLKFKSLPPSNGSTALEMELKGTPQFVLENQLGTPFLFKVERADVSVSSALFVRFPDGLIEKVADANLGNPVKVQYANEVLAAPFTFRVTRFPTRGELFLGLKLRLNNVSLETQSLDGDIPLAFRIGDVTEFSSSARAERRQDIQLNSSFLPLIEDETRWRITSSYFFDPMRIKYGGIVLQDESSSSRTVKMLVTACMKDPIFIKKPVLFRDFRVTSKLVDTKNRNRVSSSDLSTDGEVFETSDHSGCLRWSDSINHKYYESERFFIKQFTVTAVDGGSEKLLQAIVNPWNTGWLFAQDMVERSQSDIENQPVNGPRARLFLDGYRMNARGTDYKIDNQLNLYVKRKYNLLLYPKVLRHDSQAYGSMGNERLRDGLYLLRVALVKNFNQDAPDPRLYVNSWKKVVHVKGGVIATPITFDIQDLTMIGSRNKLIIEIQNINDDKVVFLPGQAHLPKPEKKVDQEKTLAKKDLVDTESGLVTNSYVGPFIPLYENPGSSMIESPELSMDSIIEEGESWKSELTEQLRADHSFPVYDQKYRLKSLKMTDASDLSWLAMENDTGNIRSLLNNLLSQGEKHPTAEMEVSSHLCRLWVDQFLPEMLQRFDREDSAQGFDRPLIDEESYDLYSQVFVSWCDSESARGHQVFSFDRKLVINELNQNRIRYNGGSSFNLNVSSNFRMDKGQGWQVRKNHSSDVSFSASAGFDTPFGGISAKRGESYSASESESYSMGRGSGLSYGSGAYLVVQHSIFRIGIEDYDQCLIVKPRFEMMEQLMDMHLRDFFPSEERGGFWSWLPFMSGDDDEDEANKRRIRQLIPDGRHLDLIDSGLRVCQNLQNPRPMEILENYYYITQHFTSGDMHDPTDLRNRLWLLQIRSARDFKVFLESVLNHNQLSDVANITNTPIHILSDSYSKFKEHLPAWPGLFTYYKYDPHVEEHCDPRQDMGDALVESFKQIAAGPFVYKDGHGIDFWNVFYCPQSRQNF